MSDLLRLEWGRHRIATVTSTSFVARPSTVGWYKFRIWAGDAAGNVSSFSVAAGQGAALTPPSVRLG